MKIGIIGGGVVGRATARAFIEHVEEVRVYDVVKERRTACIGEVLECDLVFVCLPTPQKEGSLECNLSALEEFFSRMGGYGGGFSANFVLRSTVPIGTTRRLAGKYNLLNLVHSPEFLTARCAATDAQIPSRNVIGYPVPSRYARGECPLTQLYARRFPHVPVLTMTSDESESVKLFQNAFFATKIAFFNEVNMLATKLGLRWEVVLKAILADGRISPSHTQVPGPDGKYGFGGTCLPKDLANLIECMSQAGVVASVTTGARFRNEEDRERK